MATIGSALLTPESGWKRYDDSDSNITYVGAWSLKNSVGYYNNSNTATYDLTGVITFRFKGTKIRIIDAISNNRSNNVQITIDDISYVYSCYTSSTTSIFGALVFEKSGLTNNEHKVVIKKLDTDATKAISLDAIDIDETGYLTNKKYLIQDKYSILWSYDGSILNKINGMLTEEVAINKGMNDYTLLNNQTITKIGLDGVVKGTIGVGKQFEISLDNSLNTINTIV